MKKFVCLLTGSLCAVLLMFGIASCGEDKDPGDTPPPEPAVVEPVVSDIEADVTLRPEGFSLGTYKLKEVYLNEQKLTASADYVVRDSYFIFSQEYYGALGLGEHHIRMIFEEGEKSFLLKIEDGTSPLYEYDLPASVSFGREEEIVFPVVKRENPYQDYDCRYLAYDADDRLIFNQTNVEKNSDALKFDDLALGKYQFKVQIRKLGTLIREHVCDFRIELYSNDIFSEENTAGWGKAHANFLQFGRDAEDGAMTVRVSDRNGLNGRYYAIFFPADFLQVAQLKGCKTFEFYYKVNAVMANSKRINIQDNTEAAGLRIFGKQNKELAVGEITSLTEGVYMYADETSLPTDYKRVRINIEEFLGMGEINYFCMVVSGDAGSVVSFRDAAFSDEESGLYQEDLFSQENSMDWVSTNFDKTECGWSEAQSATVFRLFETNEQLKAQSAVCYRDVNGMRSALANGMTKLKFDVSANASFLNSTSAGLRFYGKKYYRTASDAGDVITDPARGVYQYLDVAKDDFSDGRCTVTIDLEAFFALNEDINYLGCVVAGAAGSEVYFRNARYE